MAGVVFLPHPPVLVPDVAQGAAPELDELRTACAAALSRVVRRGEPIVVVGSAATTARHDAGARGTLAGFGVDLDVSLGGDEPPDPSAPSAPAAPAAPSELPLSLTVGAWLLRTYIGTDTGAVGWSVGPNEAPELTDDVLSGTLVVMGDGSARRSAAAPGYLHPDAEAFDAAVAAALAAGDVDALRSANGDLLVGGGRAWAAVAPLLETREWDAMVHYAQAPYGVGYVVASWAPR